MKLFHRTSKSVRLTQEGYMFTQYAGEILKVSEFSKARMKEMSQFAKARIVIGCRNTAELRLIVPALKRLREQSPEILPVLRLIPHDTLEGLLSDGEIHVIFTFEKDRVPPKVRYRELMRCRPVCVFNPEHPLAKCESLTLEQLKDAAKRIHDQGVPNVLAKAGPSLGTGTALDVFYDGTTLEVLEVEAVGTERVHGAGCTLAAAVTAELAKGASPLEAAVTAKEVVSSSIRHGLRGNMPFLYVYQGEYRPA